MSSELLKAYSGAKADAYDAVRSGATRWRSEIAAMEALLGGLDVRRILDCPFGTGRWIPQYESKQVSVVGIDLSKDMLAQARTKIPPERLDSYTLLVGDIFSLDSLEPAPQPDVAICVRFLNWIPSSRVRHAIHQLTSTEPRYLIVGCRVRPSSESRLVRTYRILRLHARNARHFRSPPEHVHDQAVVERALRDEGWAVREKKFIFRNPGGEGFFFLCERMGAETAQT